MRSTGQVRRFEQPRDASVTGPVTIADMLESTFSACSALALLGWVLLVFLPRQRQAHLVAALAIPLVIAAVYVVLIAQHFGRGEGGFGSLADVARLFSDPALLLAGWAHYLSFDLFIGAWEVRDAQRHGIPHLLVVPCLLLTFMLGPIGLLSYWALRSWRTGGLQLAP
jgi:Domain of unknown function (DUF4281)